MKPNNSARIKRFIIISIGLIFISIGLFLSIRYVQSRKSIEITFSNISNVKLVEFRTQEPVSTIGKSGEKIVIDKAKRYKINYLGNNGYASGSVNVDIDSDDKIKISPYYSSEKLNSLLTDDVVDSIHSAIKMKYSGISKQYTIEKGKLYHFGGWYSTALRYNKEYNEVSDTLYVIANKTPTGWKIVADPNITFDRFSYPTIPVDILHEINN